MTAAVAAAPPTKSPNGSPEQVLASRFRPRPYLTAVPDTDPPFDDEITGAARPTGNGAGGDGGQGLGPDRGDAPGQPRSASAPQVGGTATVGLRPAGVSSQLPTSGIRQPGTAAESPAVLLEPAPRGTTLAPTEAAVRISAAAALTPRAPTTIAADGVPPWSSESDIGVRRTATGDLPPARRAASVFARALVEVLSGQRPVAQLRVHCSPEIYEGLLERPIVRRLALPHLLTVRLCEPADGVAEVSAAFRRADRVRALAFRIEGVDGRWRITALQLG